MANLDINTKIINNINNDDLEAALNEIIDNELSKDFDCMNTELIDSCVNALLELEKEKNASFAVFIPLMSSKEFLNRISPSRFNWHNLNTFTRASIIAALIASTTLTANAAYESFTGVNIIAEIGNALQTKLKELGVINDDTDASSEYSRDKALEITTTPEEPTTELIDEREEVTGIAVNKRISKIDDKPVIEQFDGEDDEDEETTTKPQIHQFEGIDDDEETPTEESTTEKHKPEPTTVKPIIVPTSDDETNAELEALSADFNDAFKVDYVYGEQLSYDGLTLTAHYTDGSSKIVDISECNYTKSVDMNVTADYTLRIIYNKCVVTIDITVRPDEFTRGAEICENELFEYMLTKNGAYITKYKGFEKSLDIDSIDGNKVYAIAAEVFSATDIETVTAENCEIIFDGAFKDCTELESCYTPRAKRIGSSAFENCEKLTQPVFSDNLSYIGAAAYKNSGITELLLKSYIDSIPAEMCENCANLTIVDLRGAEAVGRNAFSECASLTQVSGTDGLKKADDFAFYNCTQAEFDEKPTKLTAVGNSAFAYCNNIVFGRLYLSELDKFAFMYCHKLTEIEISGSVKIVPEGVFRGAHLTDVTFNNGTQEIDDMAFMSTSIEKAELPSSLTRIGTYGLYSIKLKEIYCSRNLKTIESSAFFKTKLTMYVYNSSAAHVYAVENNIRYEIIDDSSGVIQFEGEDD